MTKPNRKLIPTTASLLALLLAGCGGGGGEDDVGALPINNPGAPQQCADTGTCPASGFETIGPEPEPLCSASLDYGTVFTGGSGAGELVKMKFDTAKKTYELQILESPVPKKVGQIEPTREGVTFKGRFENLTTLPTAEQNRCALELKTAEPSDKDRSQAIIDPSNPPLIFVGHGVVGGGIPGATIRFDGILGLGRIPATRFAMYPVVAFAETETDFSKVPGTYNVLGYHMVPSGGALIGSTPFAIGTAKGTETLNANGSCTRAGGACVTTGNPWKARGDGAFESNNDNGTKRYPAFYGKAISANDRTSRARGVMVVGKLGGALVPLVIRVGYANLNAIIDMSIDDESGMALMAPNKPLTVGQLNGGYIGSGSDFKYTVSLVTDNKVTLLDPLTMDTTGGYQIDFTQPVPGMATTTDNSSTTGVLIAAGPVFAHLAGNTFRASVFASH